MRGYNHAVRQILDLLNYIGSLPFDSRREIASQLVDSESFQCSPNFRIPVRLAADWLTTRLTLTGNMTSTSPWGDIVMEWWNEDRKLTFYFRHDGEVEYVKVWGPDIYNDMEDGIVEPDRISQLQDWLN